MENHIKIEQITQLISEVLLNMPEEQRIDAINQIKTCLHEHSPFINQPIDCVLWIKSDQIHANDYNPNALAPPEKRLLYTSLINNGYTQPIVVYDESKKYTIVDGFHRSLLSKEKKELVKQLNGYLPITRIRPANANKTERIAATIRHNRARGKHQISAMSDIVRDLAMLGWNDKKIASQLGMDPDEVLRLKQISGLAALFDNRTFSEAWTIK